MLENLLEHEARKRRVRRNDPEASLRINANGRFWIRGSKYVREDTARWRESSIADICQILPLQTHYLGRCDTWVAGVMRVRLWISSCNDDGVFERVSVCECVSV